TRLVSMVIHRRPHCSATYAVVPEPHVGSRMRSPGSVVISMQRSMILGLVWTTYFLSGMKLLITSSQKFVVGKTGKSSRNLTYPARLPDPSTRSASNRRRMPLSFVFQRLCIVGRYSFPAALIGNQQAAPSPFSRPTLWLVRLSSA